jgi:hypothetical protein
LHSCEVYLIYNGNQLYHYDIVNNKLVLRKVINDMGHENDSYIIVTAIVDRQSSRYGDRAFRYALLDLGHALGALRYSLSRTNLMLNSCDFNDSEISDILGFHHEKISDASIATEIGLVLKVSNSVTLHESNTHDLVNRFIHADEISYYQPTYLQDFSWDLSSKLIPATNDGTSIFLNRRISGINKNIYFRLSPSKFNPDGIGISQSSLMNCIYHSIVNIMQLSSLDKYDFPQFEFMMLVHHVDGLCPGLYSVDVIRDANSTKINFTLKQSGEFRDDAYYLSCFQECPRDCDAYFIAISDIWPAIKIHGGRYYREVHYLAGMLAHILQIEAIQNGLSSRVIGAFFDDELVNFLGFNSNAYSVVHTIAFGGEKKY